MVGFLDEVRGSIMKSIFIIRGGRLASLYNKIEELGPPKETTETPRNGNGTTATTATRTTHDETGEEARPSRCYRQRYTVYVTNHS